METGLIAIEIAARIHSVPMDLQSVRKKYFVERELSPAEMIRILRDHGFKARHRQIAGLEEERHECRVRLGRRLSADRPTVGA